MLQKFLIFLIIIFYGTYSLAAERKMNLIVADKPVNCACQNKQAIAVNNKIPGQTLHLKVGKKVTSGDPGV